MFIQTEETPNPLTLKFLPGCVVAPSLETYTFHREDDASQSPLARALFENEDITDVFFGSDFITITKTLDSNWAAVKTLALATIMDHFLTGFPVIEGQLKTALKDEDPISRQIREILDTRVRPAVAQDGGDIVFDRFEDGIVYVHMRGACSGCPSSSLTLKSGIENMLKFYVPEVMEVQQVTE